MIMTKRLFFFLIGCVSVLAMLRAQNEPVRNELFLEVSVGGAFHVTPEQRINSWLNLNDYCKTDIIITLGAKYFWSKAWGVQSRLQWNPAALSLHDVYLYDGAVLDNRHVDVYRGKVVGNASVGLVYRHSFVKWSVQPYGNVGITEFSKVGFSSSIRHLGTNDVDEFFLGMKRKNNVGFSLLPGLHITYQLEDSVLLYVDISYIMNFGASAGEYTLRNLYTRELRERQPFKDKHTNTLLLGVGVSVKLF